MHESFDGHFKGGNSSQNYVLWTQIPSTQGFGAPTFTYGIERPLEKLSLIGRFSRRHEDAYDVSFQNVFFDYLSYFGGWIWRNPHRIICSQAHYGISTTGLPTYPPIG